MSKPFDATVKDLLETRPADWLPLIGRPSSAPVEVINADLSTVTAEADKVLRIGDPDPWLLHLELQTGRDAELVRQGLRYNVLLDYRHGLPVQSGIVLLRPEADGPELTGVLQRGFPQEDRYLEFRYRVIRIWLQPVEAILTGGIGTLPLAPLTDVRAGALPEVIQRIEKRLGQEAAPAEAATLRAAAYILTGLRYPRDQVDQLFRGVQAMKESSTYQAIVDEGRVEGRAEGAVEEAKKILRRMGSKRFGAPNAETAAALEAIPDLDQLEVLTERLLDVSSWQELLAAPRSRRRNGRRKKTP